MQPRIDITTRLDNTQDQIIRIPIPPHVPNVDSFYIVLIPTIYNDEILEMAMLDKAMMSDDPMMEPEYFPPDEDVDPITGKPRPKIDLKIKFLGCVNGRSL